MQTVLQLCLMVLSAALILFSATVARSDAPKLRVATFVLPPYVIMDGQQLTGFSIDLWNAVAERLNVRTEYQVAPDVDALLAAVSSDTVDVGVSGIFITAERDKSVDFSVSILNAGLQVMVREPGTVGARSALVGILRLLFSETTLVWLGIAVVFMVIPAHLVWWLERPQDDGIVPTKKYLPGIAHALHWAATILLTQAERMPRRPLARVVSFMCLFVSIVFVASYTAQLTANLTVEQIRGAINGPEDLPGKQVSTLKGSTSADYLQGRNVQVFAFQQTNQMFEALLNGRVDATLFSAPTLHYYASHSATGKVKLVGPEFGKLDLGFVVQVDSPFRRQIDAALLSLREDGSYERLYDKWFGHE